MTLTETAPVTRTASRKTRTWPWRVFLLTSFGLALVLHLFRARQSYDLFIDEPFYARVGQSVAHGQLPFAAGVHFFLHPPGFFYVEAAWMKVFGLHNQVFSQVYSLRSLVAVFASASLVMVGIILAKVAGKPAAVVGVIVYMFNAFLHRDSAIVILEPATVFWALAGFSVLVSLQPRPTRRRKWQLAAAGLLFGVAILSKEFAVFITIVPLLVAFTLKTWLTRREALATAGLATVPYLIWVAVVIATGNWSTFYFQLSTGFSRTAGTTQITGFNRTGTPSFLDTLLRNVGYLWTAYVILVVGSVAIIYLAWRPARQVQRFIACFGLGAIPLIIYCVFIGTNEEQFFNFLLAPALIALVTVIANHWRGMRRAAQAVVVVGLISLTGSDVVNYTLIHSRYDNGTYQLDGWMAAHVPLGTVIAVTNSVQREIFTRYTMVNDTNASEVDPDVQYLVVFYRQVDEGYAFVDRGAISQQIRGLREVYTVTDRSNGRMVVYSFK